jgi:hypothetical protein
LKSRLLVGPPMMLSGLALTCQRVPLSQPRSGLTRPPYGTIQTLEREKIAMKQRFLQGSSFIA